MANADEVNVELHILKATDQDLVLVAMTNADWEKLLIALARTPNFRVLPPADELMSVKRVNITVEK